MRCGASLKRSDPPGSNPLCHHDLGTAPNILALGKAPSFAGCRWNGSLGRLGATCVSTPGPRVPNRRQKDVRGPSRRGTRTEHPQNRGVERASPSLGTSGPCCRNRNSVGVFSGYASSARRFSLGIGGGSVIVWRVLRPSVARARSREATRREDGPVRVHRDGDADQHGSPHGVRASGDRERSGAGAPGGSGAVARNGRARASDSCCRIR